MRVFEIVEVDLGDIKLPDISKATGPTLMRKQKLKLYLVLKELTNLNILMAKKKQ